MASIHSKEVLPSTAVSASFDSNTDDNDLGTTGKVELLTKDIDFIGLIKVTNASVATKEITSIITRADVADDLDGLFFVLQDEVGSVGFWIDVDNSGTSAPTTGAARDIEITTITTNMTKGQVGTAVYNAIIGDSKFEAGSDDTAGNILVQSTTTGLKDDGVDGDTGFTIVESVAGDVVASYAAKLQHSHNGTDWLDLLSFTAVSVDVVEAVQVDNTTVHVMQYIKAVLTKTTGDATFEIDLLHDRR